jgi:hypothetical protein
MVGTAKLSSRAVATICTLTASVGANHVRIVDEIPVEGSVTRERAVRFATIPERRFVGTDRRRTKNRGTYLKKYSWLAGGRSLVGSPR